MWFGKKIPFDPLTYGFSSVVDLLGAFPSVVEVSKTRRENGTSNLFNPALIC